MMFDWLYSMQRFVFSDINLVQQNKLIRAVNGPKFVGPNRAVLMVGPARCN